MAKFTLSSILGGYAGITSLNDNFTTLLSELQNKVLYRNNPDGEDNAMENTLDMNSNRIINLPNAVGNTEPVTLGQLNVGSSADQNAIDAGIYAGQSEDALTEFQQNYLGAQATAPTTDLDGNALQAGALYYNTGDGILYIWDGSAWVVVADVETGYKPIIPLYFSGTPDSSDLIVQFLAPQTFTLPAGLTDSVVYARVAPTAQVIFDLQKNGVSVGSCTIEAAANTGSYTLASPVTLASGDRFTIHAPGTADATIQDISWTIRTNQVTGSVVTGYTSDYYADSGTANAVVATATGLTVAPDALEEGMSIAFRKNLENTAAVTVNVEGLGVKDLVDTTGTAFSGGELDADIHVQARYDLANDRFYVVTPYTEPSITGEQWAVGSIYTSVLSTNPAVTFGYGTWTAFGEGRFLIGVGTGNDGTDAQAFVSAETGGKYNHTNTVAEMAAHTHTTVMKEDGSNTASLPERGSGADSGTMTSGSEGDGDAYSILNPYLAVYMWERTA